MSSIVQHPDALGGRTSLAAVASLAAGYATPALVSREARASLASLPTALDGCFSWVMLECRLDDDPRVDVVFHVDRRHRPDALRRCPAGWSHARRILSAWSDIRSPLHGLATLTFEVDHSPSGWSPPVVFAALERRLGEDPGAAVAGEARAALAPDVPAAWDGVLSSLPRGVWPMHVASLTPRGIAAARLVASVPTEAVGAFLSAARWPGRAAAAQSIADRAGRFCPRVNLHLDVSDGIAERLGMEIFHPGAPGHDARWTPVFAFLEACVPATVHALTAWPSHDAPLLRLLGLKLLVEGDGLVGAKAYLAARAKGGGA